MRRWQWLIPAGVLTVLATVAAARAQQAPVALGPSVRAANVTAQPAPGQLQSPDQNNDSAFVRFFRNAEWYASLGRSKQYWSPSDIHVSQPSLGNDFTIHDVHGTDEFSPSDIYNPDFFGPQYNIRIGRFINDARTIAIEFSLDHSKYQTTIGQTALVTGLVNNVPTNSSQQLTNAYFSEVLHNGANHVMVNAVYRYPLIGQINETLSLAGIAKAGIGLMVPHTSDTVMGNANYVGDKTLGNALGFTNGWWQINGWTAGVELGVRAVLYKPVYLELTDKLAYSRLVDLPAYAGTLQQSLWMNEIVVSLGVTYDGPR